MWGRRKVLVRKLEVKRPLGRRRQKWEDNIKVDLNELKWEGVDHNDLGQGRDKWQALVNTVMNFRVP
jgi:hypothetical protein